MAAWLFKGNLSVFDINTYLRTTNPIWWTVGGPIKRFDRICPGDRVFMFRAGDGVVALGRVLTGPTRVGDGAVIARNLWRKSPPNPLPPMVQVELEEVRLRGVDGMLLVRELKGHPVLRDLSVLRAAQGTTFAVTEEQERVLLDLWSARSKCPLTA